MKNSTSAATLVVGVIVICTFAFMAFKQAPHTSDLSNQLIGEWRNVYVKLILHHKSDSTITMEADSSNWEDRLRIKPIRTHFRNDGTYYSEYRNLKDSLVKKPSGTWSMKGDSITMTQLIPDKSVYKFHLAITGNMATFHGNIDFDGEGIDNDEYVGIQKKFNP